MDRTPPSPRGTCNRCSGLPIAAEAIEHRCPAGALGGPLNEKRFIQFLCIQNSADDGTPPPVMELFRARGAPLERGGGVGHL
jgi:hypothetical protein